MNDNYLKDIACYKQHKDYNGCWTNCWFDKLNSTNIWIELLVFFTDDAMTIQFHDKTIGNWSILRHAQCTMHNAQPGVC